MFLSCERFLFSIFCFSESYTLRLGLLLRGLVVRSLLVTFDFNLSSKPLDSFILDFSLAFWLFNRAEFMKVLRSIVQLLTFPQVIFDSLFFCLDHKFSSSDLLRSQLSQALVLLVVLSSTDLFGMALQLRVFIFPVSFDSLSLVPRSSVIIFSLSSYFFLKMFAFSYSELIRSLISLILRAISSFWAVRASVSSIFFLPAACYFSMICLGSKSQNSQRHSSFSVRWGGKQHIAQGSE